MKIFFDSTGSFVWSSIAAIAAIVGLFVNIWNNKKVLKQQKELNDENYQGNVVNKARIEWIQEVRKKSTDYIEVCYELLANIKNKSTVNDENRNRLKREVEKTSTLLILYFGPDSGEFKNNNFIVFMISVISSKIINKDNIYDIEHVLKQENNLIILRDFLRIYLKVEWKRANRGIIDKDNDIQNELENNKNYKKIRELFESDFKCHEEYINHFYSTFEKE